MASSFVQEALGQNLTNFTSPLDLTSSLTSFEFARSFIQDKNQIENVISTSILSNANLQVLTSTAGNLVKTNFLLLALVASTFLLVSILALRGSKNKFVYRILGLKAGDVDEKVSDCRGVAVLKRGELGGIEEKVEMGERKGRKGRVQLTSRLLYDSRII